VEQPIQEGVNIRDRIIELRRVKRGEILPHPLNFRRHPENQRQALRGILSDIGVAGAALAYYSEANNGALTFIDGHLRDEEIPDGLPVLITDLNDAEAALLLVTYDPLSAMASTDKAQLDSLLREVGTGDVALLEMIAATAKDAGLTWGAPPVEAPEAQVDRAAELQKKWKVKTGDLWEVGAHRILCGDSTNAEDVARLMAGERASLCFTSPPYGQQRDYKAAIGDWLKLMQGVFANLPMQDDGQVLVNLGLIHRKGEWVPYWDEWIEWMRAEGWRRFGWYVWDQGPGLPGDWAGRLAPSFEFIFHFNKQSRKPNKTKDTKWGGSENHGSGLRASDGEVAGYSHAGLAVQHTKIPDSVIRVMRHKARGVEIEHPAVFSVPLANEVQAAFAAAGGVVWEPFLGAGSSVIAAEQVNRRCYGIEIDPGYVAVALERLQELGPKLAAKPAPIRKSRPQVTPARRTSTAKGGTRLKRK
jgi:DNA modification methylase